MEPLLPDRRGRRGAAARLSAANGAAADAAARRYVVLVNRRAGAVLEQGERTLIERIETAFEEAGCPSEVMAVEPAELTAGVQGLPPGVVPVVAGGDGTLTALLPALVERRLTCGVLPIGTMNFLARDLGFSGDLERDIERLVAGPVVRIDLAKLNETLFHSVSGLGFPVAIATERERMRRRIPFSRPLAVLATVVLAAVRTRGVEVSIETDAGPQVRRADAVVVTNNVYEGPPWRRARLDEGLLEVLVIDAPGIVARIGTALAILSGRWRDLPNLEVHRARQVTLRRGRRTRLTIDGEVVRVPDAITYRMSPAALTIIAAGEIEARTPVEQIAAAAAGARRQIEAWQRHLRPDDDEALS